MDTGKIKKYLAYAIGEILLVMVGILLAIQINEYKTKKNTQSEEIVFLSFVKQDLDKDIEDLREV